MVKKDKLIISITLGIICALLVAGISLQFQTVEQQEITGVRALREDELRARNCHAKG